MRHRNNPVVGDREYNLGPALIACIAIGLMVVGVIALIYVAFQVILWLAVQP